jgi:hypothetical protein
VLNIDIEEVMDTEEVGMAEAGTGGRSRSWPGSWDEELEKTRVGAILARRPAALG